MLIGSIGRPGVYYRAILDSLPHRRRKAPLTRMATQRTDLDLGAMRCHFVRMAGMSKTWRSSYPTASVPVKDA